MEIKDNKETANEETILQNDTLEILNNQDERSTLFNIFNKLVDKQAKQFEEFGKYMSVQLKTSCQEFVKQQDETMKENLIHVEKICEKYQKQIDAQSDFIGDLMARIENLEIYSNKKDQEIRKLRKEFNQFLQLYNKLQNKESKVTSSINDKDSNLNLNLNLEGNSENENLLNNSKQIHNKIQEIITQKENIGQKVRYKHLKVLAHDFTSKDLIQHTKSEDFNFLTKQIKTIMYHIISDMLLEDAKYPNWVNWEDNEKHENLANRIHIKIQEIIIRIENVKNVKGKHFKMLVRDFTSNDLIQYVESESYYSLNDKVRSIINDIISKISLEDAKWANTNKNDREDNVENQSLEVKLEQIHVQVQEVIIRREKLGKDVKKKNLKFLTRNFTSYELIQYTRSENHNSLNDKVKKIINKFANKNLLEGMKWTNEINLEDDTESVMDFEDEELTNENLNWADDNNSVTYATSQETIPVFDNLHSQIQQVITQQEQLGFRVRLKHFKIIGKSFTVDDFIQYTNTSQFDSLDNNSKRLLNLLINETLSDEFNRQNVILSQSLDEYIRRGIIPELPLGYNNYTDYGKSAAFTTSGLSKRVKKRINKLIVLEKRLY